MLLIDSVDERSKIFHLLLYLEQNLLVGVNISWLTC